MIELWIGNLKTFKMKETIAMRNANLQHEYLASLCLDAIPVSIYLINGIKLSGLVSSFDDASVLLRDNKSTVDQLIYKHAISTIVPTKALKEFHLPENLE